MMPVRDFGNGRLRVVPPGLRTIAYSLFGIFNLHLPVLYGESAEGSLGRLLAEIISRSGNISVLDWIGEVSPFHSCFPAHITSFQMLPLPPPQPNADEKSLTVSSQPTSPLGVPRKLRGSLTTSRLAEFLSRSQTLSVIAQRFPAIPLHTPDSYAPCAVYDFHSLPQAPLPLFINRRLILPCIAHRVTDIQLKGTDISVPSYTYKMQASGLRPLEIALPDKLENATRLQGALQLVRPLHLKLLGPSLELDAVSEEQLLSALDRSFNAFLLTRLPHNKHKRIAPSTLITSRPVNRASILKSKASIFNFM
ncbi:hypothetical protein F5J12DRAFT_99553 [Pisolithus orientalis]|uniref:uncharacterized protein n=1 Tax=Pisolithus orientalis TaxID=936130 RepID=UPI00222585D3|nr:uncharacterized protein F5J12DRAFT_99553 [Pisolithus orientalis]KAI6006579.1 hypothetical protein F5J12DRAFT_99553 [Pisolithus orientalis]